MISDRQGITAGNKEKLLAVFTCIEAGIVTGPHEAGAAILI
jgi:hypothetical protein